MPFFSAVDDTKLFYTVEGHGPPLICLPGGPMQASAYLGDLGGLSRHRTLVLPDLRGTGRSAVPNDPDTCRAERLVQDVEALRVHLELERTDLLGHSAGAHLALLYATTHPERVRRLVLLTPSSTLPGIAAGAEQRLAIADTRRGEPWFARAYAALHRLLHGAGMDGDLEALAPLMYGRWDRRAQEHHRLRDMQTNQHAAAVYMASSDADRAAIQCRLDNVVCPVLLHTGEIDLNSPPAAVAQLGRLLMDSRHEVQPDAGHFPWLDSPIEFTTIINQFLDAQSWHESGCASRVNRTINPPVKESVMTNHESLRKAFDDLLKAARKATTGTELEPPPGQWSVDQVLAHVSMVNAATIATAYTVAAGLNATYDNRTALDAWSIQNTIDLAQGRSGLHDRIAEQARVLCTLDWPVLSATELAVKVPARLLSNDALVVDQVLTLDEIITGLADAEIPGHTQQILALVLEAAC